MTATDDRPGKAPGGRRTDLTPEVANAIIRAIENGMPMKAAAATAGVGESTFHHWRAKGTDGEPGDPNYETYRQFAERVELARGKATGIAALTFQQVMRGGFVTEETTRTLRDGSTETTVKRQAPDWRAADRFLRYADPGWAATAAQAGAARVEVTGAGGGPIQVEEQVTDLAASLAAFLARGAPGVLEPAPATEEEAADAVDAEVETEGA